MPFYHPAGHRHRGARVFARATFTGSAFWVVSALLLGAMTAASAASWDRLYLPLAFLAEVGLVESALHVLEARMPRAFSRLWVAGVVGLGLVARLPDLGAFAVARVPDGYWIGRARQAAWLLAVRAVVYAGGLIAGIAILAWGLRRRRRARLGIYLLAALGTAPLLFNDAVWVQGHVTGYPTLWVAGVWVLAMMWWELYTEVRRTYACLDTDAMTRAASRGYGELYGARCLLTESVGVVYGDVEVPFMLDIA